MTNRCIEERREMFMVEELVYYVTIFEGIPEPSQLDPYNPLGNAPTVRKIDQPLPSEPTIERPSKEEYVCAFEASGELPRPVQARVRRVIDFLAGIARFFDLTDERTPRRLRKALARFHGETLDQFYDSGTLARIWGYYTRHRRRWDLTCILDATSDPGYVTIF
jgi:hypothetical protein